MPNEPDGYCVLVEDYTKGEWLIASLKGDNEYVFETEEEAEAYIKDALASEETKVVPFKDWRKEQTDDA